jgi:hypothetical protein
MAISEPGFEYSVIAAPARGEKDKDAKTPTDRYALALTAQLNSMAAQGWEYMRADVLPSEERSGLTGRTTVYHNVLVFRRSTAKSKPAPKPRAEPAIEPKF